MATANDVLNIAASRIGYYAPNDPLPGSEAGRYVADLWASFPNATAAHSAGVLNWEAGASWLRGSSKEIWWCCLFVSMCLDMAGVRYIAGFPNYNCDNAISKIRAARSQKIFVCSSKYDATPGDIVMFDWEGNGSCDHVGFVRENCGSYVRTIEGNTSGLANGSQSAGNGVWPRERSWSTIRYVIHIEYDEEDDMPSVQEVWNYDNAIGKLNDMQSKLDRALSYMVKQGPVVPFGGTFYRLYNASSGAHAFTNSSETADGLKAAGFNDEGTAFVLSSKDGQPVWGLYNPYVDDYLFTTNSQEARNCANGGWVSYGVVGLTGDGSEVYRAYDTSSGRHLFTTDRHEIDSLTAESGWDDEGVAFSAA